MDGSALRSAVVIAGVGDSVRVVEAVGQLVATDGTRLFMMLPFPLPFNPFQYFIDGVSIVVSWIVSAILSAVGFFFSVGLRPMVFFKNPYYVEGFNDIWVTSLSVGFILLGFGLTTHVLYLLIFPEHADARMPYHEILDKILKWIIIMIVFRPAFAILVGFVQMITLYFYPETYTFNVGLDLFRNVVALSGGVFIMAVMAFVLGTSLLFGMLTLFLLLALRVQLIYLVYAISPILVMFYLFDKGPFQYGRMISSLLFKLTAMFLVYGILVAAVLATGAAIGAGSGFEGGGFSGFQSVSIDPHGPELGGSVDETALRSDNSLMWRLMMFISIPYLIIGIFTSLLGATLGRGLQSMSQKISNYAGPEHDKKKAKAAYEKVKERYGSDDNDEGGESRGQRNE